MKGLIRKILKEEVGYPTGVDTRSWEGKEDAISRLRIVFTKMKSMKGWDTYISEIYETKKMPGGIWASTHSRGCMIPNIYTTGLQLPL